MTSIVIRQITTTQDGTNTQTFLSMPNVTPIASETLCVIAFVEPDQDASSVTGCGITFTRVVSVTSQDNNGRLQLWSGSTPTPSTGTITMTFGAISSGVVTVCGVQNTTGFGTAVTAIVANPTLTVAALADANSICLSGACMDGFADQVITAGAGSTPLGAIAIPSGAMRIASEYIANNTTQKWGTTGTAPNHGASLNIELKASGASPPQQNVVPALSAGGLRIPYKHPAHPEDYR